VEVFHVNPGHVFHVKGAKVRTTSKELYYHGGTGGIGVETAPKVYLVYWGWNSTGPTDPAGARLHSFLTDVGGSSWLNSVTQYCQGVARGTYFCNGSGTAAGNPSGVLADTWSDDSSVPASPTQTDIANEAIKAAAHEGNTAPGSNATTQYVIALPSGVHPNGFMTQWCAWHSSSSTSYGTIAYTNLPYMPDAGAACGAGAVNSGDSLDGVTIVEGHELAETITDEFPNGGWLDSGNSEDGDKCAWISSGQGAMANEPFGSNTYPVQSLWSNAFNSNHGGCVQSYP
jgi:serine protease